VFLLLINDSSPFAVGLNRIDIDACVLCGYIIAVAVHSHKAAKESKIPALVRFAKLKEKRIDSLATPAKCPINTGRLEGYNNKIKVAKRNAYGYKNDRYFFTFRYLSLPTYDLASPKNA